MKRDEALKLRDEHRPKLIGRLFDKRKPGWDIKDVIIATPDNVADVYTKIYNGGLTNEAALSLVRSKEDAFKVYVISHQWPWGSGDLLYESIESYLKHKNL